MMDGEPKSVVNTPRDEKMPKRERHGREHKRRERKEAVKKSVYGEMQERYRCLEEGDKSITHVTSRQENLESRTTAEHGMR